MTKSFQIEKSAKFYAYTYSLDTREVSAVVSCSTVIRARQHCILSQVLKKTQGLVSPALSSKADLLNAGLLNLLTHGPEETVIVPSRGSQQIPTSPNPL